MSHIYLTSEGTWTAKGNYYDETKNMIPTQGKTFIKHSHDYWILDGYMELLLDTPIRFDNRYEITPFKNDFTNWKSFNPALGPLLGKFALIEDTIISTYTSENGIYSKVESMIKVSETQYLCKGFAFKNNSKLSSWAVTLTKER